MRICGCIERTFVDHAAAVGTVGLDVRARRVDVRVDDVWGGPVDLPVGQLGSFRGCIAGAAVGRLAAGSWSALQPTKATVANTNAQLLLIPTLFIAILLAGRAPAQPRFRGDPREARESGERQQNDENKWRAVRR